MAVTDTLQERTGPLPNWAWGGLVFVIAAGYLIYRKKQSMANTAANPTAVSSNLGTVPISNLTTEAAPMPTMGGDTFVNVSTSDSGPTGPAGPPGPPGQGGGSPPSGGTAKAKTFNLPGGYVLQRGGAANSIDILKGGKYVSGGFIPPPGQHKPLPGTPFSYSAAGDKAPGAVDIFQGSKFIGSYQT